MAENPEESQWHESLKTIHPPHSYETAASLAHASSLMTEKHFGMVVSSPSGGSGAVLSLLAAQSGDSPLPPALSCFFCLGSPYSPDLARLLFHSLHHSMR